MFSPFGLKSHIKSNNIKSAVLLFSFPFLFLVLLFIFGFILGYNRFGDIENAVYYAIYMYVYDYIILVYIIVSIWFIIAYFYHTKLIMKNSNAKFVSRKNFPEEYKILESLCISRGIKTPRLSIIDTEALNAFASGINDKTYNITLTTGLINSLNKKELRTVIAHELTHIINKDVRLLIISIIFVGIFSTLLDIFINKISRARSDRIAPPVIIAMILVGVIGYLLSIIIRFALSRKREYLADAGAVQLTKDPDSLISSLRKISSNFYSDKIPSNVMQMCIQNKPYFRIFSLFSTHPSIEDRIEALKKYADGREDLYLEHLKKV